MSKPSLAELIRESARNVEAERAHNAKVARITEDVKARLAKRAETPKPMSCPRCGEPLPESWRTDPATSGTDNEDDVNVGDGAEVPISICAQCETIWFYEPEPA